MYYFHIEYLKKRKAKRFVIKAKDKTMAIKTFKNELIIKGKNKIKILKCKRSNEIDNCYNLTDAKWIVHQNLEKGIRKSLSVKKVKQILNLFYDYLDDNGFRYEVEDSGNTRTKAHCRDENIPPEYRGDCLLLSALDICSYVQFNALIKFGKLFYFDDIYEVFVAETRYLEEINVS